jgi:hypothetical protein
MSNILPTHQDSLDRIKGIDLGAIDKTAHHAALRAAAPTSGTASANDGSMLSFLGNVTGQMKLDILYSTLLAQLAASAVYNRQTQVSQWYGKYSEVLMYLGWTLQSFDFTTLSDANSFGSVDRLVIKTAETYLSGQQLELFKAMITSLNSTNGQLAHKIFDNASKNVDKANFQLGVVSNANGNGVMAMGFFAYDAHQNIDKVLFFRFGSTRVDFRQGNQVMTLNGDFYAIVRQAVINKLGDRVNQFIIDLPI